MTPVFALEPFTEVVLDTKAPLYFQSTAFAGAMAARALDRGEDSTVISIAAFEPKKPFHIPGNGEEILFDELAALYHAILDSADYSLARVRMMLMKEIKVYLAEDQPLKVKTPTAADFEPLHVLLLSRGYDAIVYPARYHTEERLRLPAGLDLDTCTVDGISATVTEIRVLNPSALKPIDQIAIREPADILKLAEVRAG